MSFVKLDCNITESALWLEDADTIRVWIYLLVKANAVGVVRVAVPVIASHNRMPAKRVQEILDKFAAPDPNSRCPDDKGRRIAIVSEPDWHIKILSYDRYRDKDHTAPDRQRRHREKLKTQQEGMAVTRDVTDVTAERVTVTQAEADAEADAEAEAEAETEEDELLKDENTRHRAPERRTSAARASEDFQRLWKAYPQARRGDKTKAYRAWVLVRPPRPDIGMLMFVLDCQKTTRVWQRDNGRHIPFLATYLRDRWWEKDDTLADDEPPGEDALDTPGTRICGGPRDG